MEIPAVSTDKPEMTTRLQIDPPKEVAASTSSIVGAAFRTENTVGSLLSSGIATDDGKVDYSFDSLSAMPERHKPYATEFVGLNNQVAVDRVASELDREQEDRQILENGGFAAGASMVGAGMLDPIVLPFLLVPGLNASVAGAKVGRAAATLGLSAAGGAALSEVALQSTQHTRTMRQSAINIGGAAVLGSVLGAGISRFTTKEVDALTAKVGSDLFTSSPRSVGAAAAPFTTIEEETLKSAAGLEKVLKAPLPSLRGAQSVALTTRKAIQSLIDDPFYRVKNEAGKVTEPSVELNIRLHDARLGATAEFTDKMFTQYRTGEAKSGLSPRLIIGIKDKLGGRGGKLTYRQFRNEIGTAMAHNDQHAIPEVAEAAKFYRSKVFDPLKQQAQELGLLGANVEVAGADSYLTRVYNIERINAKRTEFKNILKQWVASEVETGNKANLETVIKAASDKAMGSGVSMEELDAIVSKVHAEFIGSSLTDAEVDDVAESIINNINGHPAGLIPRDIVPTAGVLKARTLTIPDDNIAAFLERDIDMVAEHYIRTLAPEIEMTKRFGSTDIEDILASITDEYNALIDLAPTEKAAGNLSKLKEADLNDVRDMRDLLMHKFEQTANPASGWARASRFLREINYIRLLGGMTVSAIPDLARPMMVHGLGNTGHAIVQMVRDFGSFKMSAANVKLAGTGWDYVLNTRARRIADVGDVYKRGTLIEKGTKALSDSFGVPSLMAPWNAALKQFSGVVVTNAIIQESIKSATGIITKKTATNLARLGIDADTAGRIAYQFKQHGEDKGGLMITNIEAWDDNIAKHAMNAAIVKDVDTIIITPGIGDRPTLMNKELGKLVLQFKTFAFASTNRMLLLGLQQKDAAALNGLILSIALGAVVYGTKQKLAGRDIAGDGGQVLAESIDRSGVLGYLSDMNNIVEKLTGGTVGISALTGSAGMSRYASRNVVGAALGPSFGTVEDLRKIISASATGSFSNGDMHSIRKMLPYQNLFYLRGLLDKLENEVASDN